MNKDHLMSIEKPKNLSEMNKTLGNGIYILTYVDGNCNEYTAHITLAQLEVIKIEEEFKKKKYDLDLIEKYKDALSELADEENRWN